MRAFNRSRQPSGHPECPTAEAIHQRFNLRRTKVSWQEILEIACSGRDPTQWLSTRDSEPDRPYLTEYDCAYALRVVCRELGGVSFSEGQYTLARERIIQRDRRRPSGGLAYKQLPTANQILNFFGMDWAQALTTSGLPAYEQRRKKERGTIATGPRPDALPIISAIEHYARENGQLPSKTWLEEFAQKWDVAISGMHEHTPWNELLAEAERIWLDRGEDPPPRPRSGVRLDLVRVPAERPPGIARRGGSSMDPWNRELIIEKLREYARILGPRRGSQRDYRRRIDQNPDCGWPTTSTITRHGLRFQQALAEARRAEEE